jgi:hypothetical protein
LPAAETMAFGTFKISFKTPGQSNPNRIDPQWGATYNLTQPQQKSSES